MTELTPADIKRLMAKLSYKPNFDFRVIDDPGELRRYGLSPIFPVGIEIIMYTLDSELTYAPATQLTGRTATEAMFGIGGENGKIMGTDPLRWGIPERVLKGGEEAFWRWLHDDFITWLEHHEIDEWFKIDGVPLNVAHDARLPGVVQEWYAKWSEPETFCTAGAKVAAIADVRMAIEGAVDGVRRALHDSGVSWDAINSIPGLEPTCTARRSRRQRKRTA